MGDHVGLGELATFASDVATAEAPLDVVKERGVEVDLLIERTVERSHCGLRDPAARAGASGVHDQRRRLIGLSGLGKYLPPLHFRASKHSRYEIPHLIGWRLCAWLFRRGLRLLLRTAEAQARQDFRSADQVKRVNAQRPADEAQNNEGADADAAATAHAKAARSTATPIFYLVAAR